MRTNRLWIGFGVFLAGLACASADARWIETWSFQRLRETAAVVVVGSDASTERWPERLPDRPFGDREALEGRLTTFDVETVFKGEASGKHLQVVHFSPRAGKLFQDGPLLAVFRQKGRRLEIESVDGVQEKAVVMEGTPHYLLFLKKRGDGKYEPVSGQIDSALSVRRLSGIAPLFDLHWAESDEGGGVPETPERADHPLKLAPSPMRLHASGVKFAGEAFSRHLDRSSQDPAITIGKVTYCCGLGPDGLVAQDKAEAAQREKTAEGTRRVLATFAAGTAEHPDGVQWVTYRRDPGGKQVRTVLDRLPKVIATCVHSTNNENTEFRGHLVAEVEYEADVTPQIFSSGRKYTWSARGKLKPTPPATFFVYEIRSRAEARAVAKVLGVSCALRKHLQHELKATFKPLEKAYQPGKPVRLLFTLTNTGEVPVTFEKGGDYGSTGRPERFSFRVTPEGGQPYDCPKGSLGGGLCGPVTLGPGTSDSEEVDVSQWYEFKGPGKYTIHGSFQLQLSVPHDEPGYPANLKWAHEKWDDSASDTVTITVAGPRELR